MKTPQTPAENQIHFKKSKSLQKREAKDKLQLATELVLLERDELDGLKLPANIQNAIQEFKKIKSHGARKRQIQYIGKLLRKIDTMPIFNSIQTVKEVKQQQAAQFHNIEHWRDRLIKEGDLAVNQIVKLVPAIERQSLRQLVRNAQIEVKNGKKSDASRKLFRFLREFLIN